MRRLFLSAALALAPLVVTAQPAPDLIPDRRAVYSTDTDFPGGDIFAYRDTTIEACENACRANGDCQSFTFNENANACFGKAGPVTPQTFVGALSARLLTTDPAAEAIAATRAADLADFITDDEIAAYAADAQRMGYYHRAGEFTVARLLDASGGESTGTFGLLGATIAVSDNWADWRTYATRQASNNDSPRIGRLSAIVNAYLRTPGTGAQVQVLRSMAVVLEDNGRGRDAIPALRTALALSPDPAIEEALDRVIGLYGFYVDTTDVESDTATPRICAIFNEPLVQAGLDYSTYVQLPDPRLAVSVQDNELCIDGVRHGERYRVVLRQGLPAASGEVLERPVELALYVRDRMPAVRFISRAYVLPNSGDIAMPIETVNLETVDITVGRVSDRNILRAMQEDMFASPLYAWQQEYFERDIGTPVWQGVAEVSTELNRDGLTRLPLSEALEGQPAGLYVISATIPGADPYDTAPASQWFILSDVGLTTMRGTDGLTVIARSLASAGPIGGADVTLLSRANEILGTATTDAEGVARFEPGLTRGTGAAAPALVLVANGIDDVAFLSLTDPAFDLSDRGVEGREAAPPIDVFLTTDRGAYRAGETIFATALMRDAQALALPGVPLTAIVYRPDGVEWSRIASTADAAGGHVFALPIAGTAPRGAWRIEVKADVDGDALADTSVLVEDFLPERIDFDIEAEPLLALGSDTALVVDARFLFGPAAPDLPVEGEVLVRAADGLPAYPGYVFGRYDERFEAQQYYVDGGERTDAFGRAVVPVFLDAPAAPVAQPLEAVATLRVSEGSGRPVERRLTVPVAADGPMIGIRPDFEDVVAEGDMARFSLVAVIAPIVEAAPPEMEAVWTINRLETRYQWYQYYGDWNWEPITSRTRIATGTATLGADPVQVSAPVDWGRYEIVVESTGGTYVATSTDFYAGWYAPADAGATPDFLEASLDADSYAVGDTATFRVVPRAAGTAIVTVMTNRVVALRMVEVSEGENLITLPVTDEWGAGVYVSASVIRPMEVDAGRNPSRALGLAYASVDPGARALDVTIDAPDIQRPRGPLSVSVQIDGLSAGDTGYVTLAAVDVGILNLTAFAAPDPQGHYFGQRKLGVELRDIYGRLIDGLTGTLGAIRTGGDGQAGMGTEAPPPTEELVAYFTGPVRVDAQGRAELSFDIPSFNGTVRLSAVAWSETGVGQASSDVVVRDPVVVTASVPRFMAPGDESRLLLEITHTDGPSGEMALAITADGLSVPAGAVPASFTLEDGGRQILRIPVIADLPGIHTVTISLTTPDGETLDKVLTVPVQVNDPEVAVSTRLSLAPGETFTFDDAVFANFRPGSGSATLSVGPLARFDAPGLLLTLDRYPYGCTEQITSRALPLLYLSGVASAMGLAEPREIDARINDAIVNVLGNQAANGAFGLWGPYSGDLWLDAYVTDFLSRARAEGYAVPDRAFAIAMDNLQNKVNYAPDFEQGGGDLAYALYVLAREGSASVGDLRYYADEKAGDFGQPLGLAQLGAALALYGDQPRADMLFERASRMVAAWPERTGQSYWRYDYGSGRRDAAAVLALATEVGSTAVDAEMLTARATRPAQYLSTQEAVWSLLAVQGLIDNFAQTGVTIDGAIPDGPLVRLREADTNAAPVRVANGGTQPTELTISSFGVPSIPEPAGGTGFAIARDYYALDGTPVTLDNVAVGTRLVTVLTVTPFGRQESRLMVNDPLPAGFEIDNPNLLAGGDLAALDWLTEVTPENTQFRQERFLSAVDWRSDQPFQLAYIVRAVSPGSFHHPAASVEDMYRPDLRANTDAGTVTVSE